MRVAMWDYSRADGTPGNANVNCTSREKETPICGWVLVQGAQHILGPFGEDSDLRRWGLKLAERGGRNGKKRAIVAVARKLAILLHHLWISCEAYEPLHNKRKRRLAAA
jgi:hypothetical protein